jgi:hypothetical protein
MRFSNFDFRFLIEGAPLRYAVAAGSAASVNLPHVREHHGAAFPAGDCGSAASQNAPDLEARGPANRKSKIANRK